MNVPGEPLLSPLRLAGAAVPPWPASDALPPDARHYYLAREALAALCAILPPGPVGVPALICAEALEGLPAINREASYFRVTHDLTPDWQHLESLRPRPAALLLVHYFGIESATAAATAWCAARGVTLIHDRAHCLPALAEPRDPVSRGENERRGESSATKVAAFSIYSLRKQLPVSSGAILRADSPGAAALLSALPQPRGKPGLLPALRDAAAWAVFKSGSARARRLLAPALSDERGLHSSAHASGASAVSRRVARRLLDPQSFGGIIARRRSNYEALARELSGLDHVRPVSPGLPDAAAPWGFAARVDSEALRDSLLETLLSEGIGAWTWPDLPPDVAPGSFPFEHQFARESLVLPVHQDLSERQSLYIADTVAAWSLQ